MKTSRRKFVTGTLRRAGKAGLLAAWTAGATQAATNPAEPSTSFRVFPVGRVEKQGSSVRLRILDPFVDALLGLEEWSHVNVIYWFDQNDVPEKRSILRVHPRGNQGNPLTGVFACRAPVRPNLIALSVCKLLSVQGNLVHIESIDALDATPILDLKPFIPTDAPKQDVRVPAWARR